MPVREIVFVMASYLWGSIPTAYIAGRLVAGIDIRQYGSGNVGGSNVWQHVGRVAFAIVGPFDFLKGLLPVLLVGYLDLPTGWVVAAGLAATCGHAWSIYLGFTGGRGLSTSLGVMAILAPWVFLTMLACAAFGHFTKTLALSIGVAMAISPLLAWMYRHSPEAIVACAGLAGLIFIKPILANDPHLSTHGDWRRVLLYRILYDRDIADAEDWIKRKPGS